MNVNVSVLSKTVFMKTRIKYCGFNKLSKISQAQIKVNSSYLYYFRIYLKEYVALTWPRPVGVAILTAAEFQHCVMIFTSFSCYFVCSSFRYIFLATSSVCNFKIQFFAAFYWTTGYSKNRTEIFISDLFSSVRFRVCLVFTEKYSLQKAPSMSLVPTLLSYPNNIF